MEKVALFLFIATVVVAVFAFLSVASWAGIRSEERRALERMALLRKLADQPVESARLVLDHVRDEDLRREQRRAQRARLKWRDGLQAGLILVAVGVGLGGMVEAVSDKPGIWSIGLVPTLVGLVVATFALASRPKAE
jgi:hypothetical protein